MYDEVGVDTWCIVLYVVYHPSIVNPMGMSSGCGWLCINRGMSPLASS